jgi:hypothetical protein
MARPLRFEFAGAVYRMARGNQGRPICLDEAARKRWLAALGAACQRTGWRVHAWVLMGNHYATRVSQPVSWVEGTLEAEVVALKRKLEQKV